MPHTLAVTASPERERTIALIVARFLAPGSKLAADTARDSLAEMLGIEAVDEDELYAAMDWLLERQRTIEQRLTKRGYSRDGKRDKLQIVFGLLCNRDGCPIAVEVFDGNTADPNTVGVHIEKLRQRFALSRVVLVGDRGMLTEARIREEVAPAGLDWISALRAPAIRELMSSGTVQRPMFDETDLAEIRCDAYALWHVVRMSGARFMGLRLRDGTLIVKFVKGRRSAQIRVIDGEAFDPARSGLEIPARTERPARGARTRVESLDSVGL